MISFDDMLKNLHSSAAVTEQDECIEIGVDRTFIVPVDFNTTIAYEGDVNSQIITFKCPRFAEGHDLSLCAEKRLRWINFASKNEGSSKLICKKRNGEENYIYLEWQAQAEAFTKAGQLEIAISIFDMQNGKMAYSWNTSVFSGLKVGASLDSVGYLINNESDEYIPAKNEILTINTETRAITAPIGYNATFCNYGDIGTSVIYFQVKRYIRGIDLLDENTSFRMFWKITNLTNTESSTITHNLYAMELSNRDSEGMVNIIWKPSEALTNNGVFYSGKVVIELEILAPGKVWRTAPYSGLIIGTSEFSSMVTDLPENEGVSNGYIIDGAQILDDKVVNTVAGVVKLRSCTETQNVIIRRGELVIVNDDLGKYKGVKIGVIDGDSTLNSPYVALAPDTIIRLNGGDASGN